MSSSFNWWEEDDDDDIKIGRESHLSQFSQPQFQCEHCGSTDSYHDPTSGQDVCTSCFTQSQVNVTQEVDEDDIHVLAARRGTALKAMRPSYGGATKQGKRPLEELDQSQPLPNLEVCLEAMSHVIMEAARLFAIQVLQLRTIHERHDYLQTVQRLWLRYLCAWKEGAQEMGEKYPVWRFSFRDLFLPSATRGLVMANLAYWSKRKVEEQLTEERKNKASIKQEDDESNDRADVKDTKTTAPSATVPTPKKSTGKTTRKRPLKTPSTKKMTVERLIASLGERSDYKRAALRIEPSMDLIMAIVWLACSKQGITSFQACQWMSQSPLLRAFALLPPHLQRKATFLQSSFFAVPCAPRPRTLEDLTTWLAAACQMKTCNNWSETHQEVIFHSVSAIPAMLKFLVKQTQLPAVIYQRSLGLLGLEEGVTPWPGLSLDHFSRTEDFLALVALACLMDPQWMSWSFRLSGKVNIPWNECHFAHLTHGDIEHYLDFLDRQRLFAKSRVWYGFETLSSLFPEDEDDDSDDFSESKAVAHSRPLVCDLSRTFDDKEAKFHLLLGFLAYSVQGDVTRIRRRLAALLEAKQKTELAAKRKNQEKRRAEIGMRLKNKKAKQQS
ncbi:hypothetical protein FisN_20Hh073 [Fistulifera solaris]|uniref:GATA-type domain-containing protein n=1 Tax=Fistulifera solaris TaxID=1519565 RepID=A0A1Z5KCA2_FISSO|nr:hypothetical protein FisN_20Hh073 [Fistulifera solaris]|eukprot:GAX23867.1 hypothetical protein FisN_20Hh073 [Fistulifera solaris]